MRFYKFLTRSIWYNKNLNLFLIVYYLLFYVFELIYIFIVFFRKKLYEHGLLKAYKFNVPIIVVGNITVGGTGKTPLVIYIANYLKTHGFNPGIVSRGYKSKCKTVSLVNNDSDPEIFGDEPVLLAKSTVCPVVVGKDRTLVVNFLLKNHSNINVIICDDGLQHYKLKRDLEIAVVDRVNQFGNRHCLPLGPLREPIERLKTVDLTIINGETGSEEDELDLECKNRSKNNYVFKLAPETIYNLLDPNNIKTPKDFTTVHAVSGIGNNQRFFDLLRNLGIKIIKHEFPDHYSYQEKDLNFNDNLPIIMTAKDAVKCIKFAKNNFWCQTVKVEIKLLEEFNNYLINFLSNFYVKQ